MLRGYIKKIQFNQNIIIKDSSFRAHPGEITVITGSSGTGKTTIFKALYFQNDFLDEYFYQDINLKALDDDQQSNFVYHHIANVSQYPKFIKDLTVLQHLKMINSLTNNSIPPVKWIKLFKLDKCLNKYPLQLSGGEQIRFAILLAIIKNTDILILDEPTSSLDSNNTNCIIAALKEYASKNNTVIVFSHSTALIEAADTHYKINNQKLELIQSNDNNVEYQTSKNLSKNLKPVSKILRKIDQHQKYYKSFINGILIIFIAFASFSFDFNNIIASAQNKQLNEIKSPQIIVYKRYPTEASGCYVFDGLNNKISSANIKKLKQIKHIKRIDWRYDIESKYSNLNFLYYNGNLPNEKLKVVLFDKKNFPESKYMYDDGDNLLTQCTYDKDNTSRVSKRILI